MTITTQPALVCRYVRPHRTAVTLQPCVVRNDDTLHVLKLEAGSLTACDSVCPDTMLAEEEADGVVAVPDDAAEDAAGDTRWATTLARVARGVVVIKARCLSLCGAAARKTCTALARRRRLAGRHGRHATPHDGQVVSRSHALRRKRCTFPRCATLPLLLVLTNALHHRALRRGRLIPVREDPPETTQSASAWVPYPLSPPHCLRLTEVAGSAYATGFVIDAARGLILTNRVSSTRPARQEERSAMKKKRGTKSYFDSPCLSTWLSRVRVSARPSS